MTAKQTRRLLIVAFALSLLLHLVAAPFVHLPSEPSVDQEPVVHVMHVLRIARAIPTIPPTPVPTPVPSAVPTRSPARSGHPKTSNPGSRNAGVESSATPGPASHLPAPSPSPTPDCYKVDTPVTIAASPSPPDIPPEARTSTTVSIARVAVVVDASGQVTSTAIAQTTGDAQLDQIAVAMARSAQYAPATHACKRVASQYAYSVKFAPY